MGGFIHWQATFPPTINMDIFPDRYDPQGGTNGTLSIGPNKSKSQTVEV